MSVAKEKRKEIIESFAMHSKDTGSSEVQIALLTDKIKYLTDHVKIHPKDFHSRRGFLIMVNKRKKLLSYLKTKDNEKYMVILEKLNLRGVK